MGAGVVTTAPKLTERELKIIELLAEGKNRKRVAETIGYSFSWTAVFVEQMRAYVGAKTDCELVAMALRRGWIS